MKIKIFHDCPSSLKLSRNNGVAVWPRLHNYQVFGNLEQGMLTQLRIVLHILPQTANTCRLICSRLASIRIFVRCKSAQQEKGRSLAANLQIYGFSFDASSLAANLHRTKIRIFMQVCCKCESSLRLAHRYMAVWVKP